MKSFADIDIETKGDYLKLLSVVSKISGLFSESSIPYINYRLAENIFCRSFNATNLSRSDTAFDANYNSLGIGLKTFTCNSNYSNEKVAEFNSLSKQLSQLEGVDLAIKLSEFRNHRILMAQRIYEIEKSLYHIVARKENKLLLFETDYDIIDIESIHNVQGNKASLQFKDKNNSYSFNYSKNTLFRKFYIPEKAFELPIEIINDPFSILLQLFEKINLDPAKDKLLKGVNYVVLPLYGKIRDVKYVFEKSGLNQWNAGGRKRDQGEIYIPIPALIHRMYPDFFPSRDVPFSLSIPSGEIYSAKVCQDGSKALMTDPNKAMSDWLLRKVLQLEEGELATIEKLDELGFDSVIIIKTDAHCYKIDILKTNSFENFISE
jgi:hypothetical protein